MTKAVQIIAFLSAFAALGQAQLLPEAAAAFPATTYSAEYDALAKLRTLPSYANLRKQYSGEGLQRVQRDLLLMGIAENQLIEVVTAAGQNGFFGMISGDFHSAAVSKQAARNGFAEVDLEDGPVFCAKEGTCLLLLTQEDGRGFFGTLDQLRAISEVRQGRALSLQTNRTFVDLTTGIDQQLPVIGFAPGREIGDWIGTSVPPTLSARLDFTRLFANIQSFGYGVKLDARARVGLNLICSTEQAGTLIADTLSAASGLERAAAVAAGSGAMPFDHLVAQASGRMVSVKLDAPIQ